MPEEKVDDTKEMIGSRKS